jgi:DNA ligase-1
MLRRAGSRYEAGRSATLLKVKRFLDAEARVLGHQEGAGRHKGRLGALLVETADGTTFAVGTGFSDVERSSPPSVGSLITFRYQELSEGGVPRFPSYVGLRAEAEVPPPRDTVEAALPIAAGTRRFELSEGGAHKFWEVAVRGAEVTVRYGRLGTAGQTGVKAFPDEAAAQKHAEKLIAEKTRKGYAEARP